MKTQYPIVLIDTFNDKQLSHHRTIEAAISARKRHLKAVKRANGKDSFLTYDIRRSDGEPMDEGELHTAEWNAAKP